MEIKGKIVVKKSDNKAFKLGEEWYNINNDIIPILEKINKGDEVVITYEQRGVSRFVSKIVLANAIQEEKPKEDIKFKCEVCGAPLKDGKYKKCYKCNQSGATKPQSTVEESTEFKCEDCGAALKNGKYKKCYICGKKAKSNKSQFVENKSHYGSPEDVAGKEIGCALGAAATVASSQQFNDPEIAKQFTLILADEFLTWIRAQK